MSDEYRFLRFEIVGISTMAFTLFMLAPVIGKTALEALFSNMNVAISLIALLFLISLPLGWFIHQIVVNSYRSEKNERSVFVLIDILLKKTEFYAKNPSFSDPKKRNAFLTILLDVCIHRKDSVISPEIEDRLSTRWSHFYARRAIGRFAPIVTVILFIITNTFAYLMSWLFIYDILNIAGALVIWVIIAMTCYFFIDHYATKLWYEICTLESTILLTDFDKNAALIKTIAVKSIENPDYLKLTESTAIALLHI